MEIPLCSCPFLLFAPASWTATPQSRCTGLYRDDKVALDLSQLHPSAGSNIDLAKLVPKTQLLPRSSQGSSVSRIAPTLLKVLGFHGMPEPPEPDPKDVVARSFPAQLMDYVYTIQTPEQFWIEYALYLRVVGYAGGLRYLGMIEYPCLFWPSSRLRPNSVRRPTLALAGPAGPRSPVRVFGPSVTDLRHCGTLEDHDHRLLGLKRDRIMSTNPSLKLKGIACLLAQKWASGLGLGVWGAIPIVFKDREVGELTQRLNGWSGPLKSAALRLLASDSTMYSSFQTKDLGGRA